jgi:hypothetical protein
MGKNFNETHSAQCLILVELALDCRNMIHSYMDGDNVAIEAEFKFGSYAKAGSNLITFQIAFSFNFFYCKSKFSALIERLAMAVGGIKRTLFLWPKEEDSPMYEAVKP